MSDSVDPYVGPDRRQRLPRAVHEPNRRLLITLAVAVAVYGVGVPTAIAEALGAGRVAQASIVGTIVCAILFAQGGLLLLLRWRLTGDSRTCLLGVAALIFGFFVAPLVEVFALLGADAPGEIALQSVAQSLVGIVAAGFAFRSVFSAPVDSRLRLSRTLSLAVGALAVVCGAGYVAYLLAPLQADRELTIAITALAGVGWLSAGIAVLWRGRRGKLEMSSLLSAPFLVLALASAAGVIATYVPVPFSLDASALAISAALLLAAGAAYSLLATLSDQGTSALRLRSMLRSLERYRALEEERVHDARSALLAVQTAITALTRYRERLDDQSRNNLELAVDSELERLVGLMGKGGPEVPQPTSGASFDAVEPVATVVTAARTFGVQAELDVPSGACPAVGCRDDLARVVETLLGNARRYAPGSPVAVRVRTEDERVVVTVADRGPGIPAGEREVIFRRGVRGSTSAGTPGSGLGLYSARRLLEGQGGTLTLEHAAARGATFVATLPAALPTAPSPARRSVSPSAGAVAAKVAAAARRRATFLTAAPADDDPREVS